MRKFWILLAAATLAVIYFAVTPGGPLSVAPHASLVDNWSGTRIADLAPAMTDAGETGHGSTIDETVARVLDLLGLPASVNADS
ncbi:hypothetical protein [Breoghania sp. JC706]|uniref:hypothetical protein n=1 Tax=Breoghania sp. JC706 TaxID=3117732 RepID=UPI0030098AB4